MRRQNEDCQAAHMHRPPKATFAGPNVFEMHEIIQLAEATSSRGAAPA